MKMPKDRCGHGIRISIARRSPGNPGRNVKADFSSASIVGSCVVFNIGGNKYRLVVRILYVNQKVYVLKVMTHEEYDEEAWIEQCGCFFAASQAEGAAQGHGLQAAAERTVRHGEQDKIRPERQGPG